MSSTIDGFAETADGYDYSAIETLVDVGGGEGLLLAAVLQRYPSMRGVLFDLPAVVAGADEILAAAGVAERVEIVGGDMFAAIPAGGDAYVFSTVFRCFDDPECLTILQRCREVLPTHGRLLAIEMVPPDGPWEPPAGLGDLDAMVLYGGADRTEQEWRSLLAQAGFELRENVPLDPPYRLIVAV
jgi:cyclopropane fatty-acyl-phospholipid synthase-like methyltransferase